MKNPQTSSAQEHEGDDYPMDGIAPGDLPVRNIRGDEDERYPLDGAGTETADESRQGQAEARAVDADSFEVMSAASQIVPSPPASDDHQPHANRPFPLKGRT